MKAHFFCALVACVGAIKSSAQILNLSNSKLPGELLPAQERERLTGIRSAAAARALLDSVCVVTVPTYRNFLEETPGVRVRDTYSAGISKTERTERETRGAVGKAERLTRALERSKVEGLRSNEQVATTLRRVIELAILPTSAVKPEAQTWLRAEVRLQAAIGSVFEGARRSREFDRAAPAVDYLTGRGDKRTEDSFAALADFMRRHL